MKFSSLSAASTFALLLFATFLDQMNGCVTGLTETFFDQLLLILANQLKTFLYIFFLFNSSITPKSYIFVVGMIFAKNSNLRQKSKFQMVVWKSRNWFIFKKIVIRSHSQLLQKCFPSVRCRDSSGCDARKFINNLAKFYVILCLVKKFENVSANFGKWAEIFGIFLWYQKCLKNFWRNFWWNFKIFHAILVSQQRSLYRRVTVSTSWSWFLTRTRRCLQLYACTNYVAVIPGLHEKF